MYTTEYTIECVIHARKAWKKSRSNLVLWNCQCVWEVEYRLPPVCGIEERVWGHICSTISMRTLFFCRTHVGVWEHIHTYTYVCVLILLHKCPHATTYVSSCYYVSAYSYICVLILLHIYASSYSYIYASSYSYICVLILLQALTRVIMARRRREPQGLWEALHKKRKEGRHDTKK